MVHGLGVSNRYLVPALRAFARDHRVFAPDLPGVGRSSKPERDLSMAELADGLVAWMDVVGVGPPCSSGTPWAARSSPRWPPATRTGWRRWCWRAPRRTRAGERAAAGLAAAGRRRLANVSGMLIIAATDYPRVGLGAMLRTLRSATRRRAQPNLDAVDQRTLLVRGGRDPLVSEDWVQRLAGRSPRLRRHPAGRAARRAVLRVGRFVEEVHTFVEEVAGVARGRAPGGGSASRSGPRPPAPGTDRTSS